jgi:hypothetical protein
MYVMRTLQVFVPFLSEDHLKRALPAREETDGDHEQHLISSDRILLHL